MKKGFKSILSLILCGMLTVGAMPIVAKEDAELMDDTSTLYEKGNFVTSYNPVISRMVDGGTRAWRDGLVSGNGRTGYITSGEPYSDAFIFQNIFYNFPTSQPRYIPSELTGQLEEARLNVFNLNDDWKIKDQNGNTRKRTFLYSYHPGAQLRLTTNYTDKETDYIRWTNYETAETGVKFTDKYGTWERTTFTSRPDDVAITKMEKSTKGTLINMTVSMDDIEAMAKGWDGFSTISQMKYKKIVPADCSYIAQLAKYPAYSGSELYDGGYATVTYIIAEGENAKKTRVITSNKESYFVGENSAVKIENAEAVYLITVADRTFEMTGQSTGDVMTRFSNMTSYPFLEDLVQRVKNVKDKYTKNSKFSYDAALEPSAKIQEEAFNRVSFDLSGDEEYASYDNNALISLQRNTYGRINHEFMRRAYDQARYAQICCGGSAAPRLYGMWCGEWNPGWRSIYTLDANVNLQTSAMNTGNLDGNFQYGYITYFLRHAPDFMENARMAYGMHDAIQLSVNTDADRAMHVEYDNAYPFQYWNAGASWCLLPIYEYWQCYGNCQIPINEDMRFENLQHVLGVNDGGLTDAEYNEIKERGYLDLEKDILLPLLIKQANFWEQIVTPRYYTDVNGKACHDENKTELLPGEKYIIIPTYSPENSPIGYYSTLTANATMDIAAARDGLDMVSTLAEAVGMENWEERVEEWQNLKEKIADYKVDTDGALREWAMEEYTENNNHRHLSHLYVAWPAYDTQTDPDLAKAANKALDNRQKYNTGDATAGHGWMHQALVEARLKRGDGMMTSLLKMMNGTAYYSSMMTDHDTNRRNDTYCTDTAFGTLGAINEALAFSNTGQIEIIPALPKEWTKGSVDGLMARTRVELSNISWDIENKEASVTLTSLEDDNAIRLSSGEAWTKAVIDGEELEIKTDEVGNYVEVTLMENEPVTVEFTLSDATNGTYTIEQDGEYLQIAEYENGSELIWGNLNDKAYWDVTNTTDGYLLIRSTATGKYVTTKDSTLIQTNYTGEENQKWSASDFNMTRLTTYKDVTITPDKVSIAADGEETDLLTLTTGDTIMLSAKVEPIDAAVAITWATDSVGNGVVTSDGKLTAYAPGNFNVIAKTGTGYEAKLPVRVNGEARDIVKAEIENFTSSDNGYNGSWVPQNMFDGVTGSAYASKDDGSVKYIEVELSEEKAISLIYVTGRFTGADGEGAYAKRINGAKVYASNSPIRGNVSSAVLVGEINDVTATSAYVPARVEINTKGEKYKYYTVYFNTVNNGSNISLAIDDIAFYTGGASFVQTLTPIVTAQGGANPTYATDGNINTVFTISNQTESTNENQYIQFEFNGIDTINKIVVKKAYIDGSYWADHALAVGCELQGSTDGIDWETIHVMNTWPDGTDSQSEVMVNLEEAKAYKYIRYIRTTVKKSGDYAYWKWSSTDGGNRISLADIEFYTIGANVKAEIVKIQGTSVTVSAESNVKGKFNLITAVYEDKDKLIKVVTTPIELEEKSPREFEIETEKEGTVKVFVWGDNMLPVSERIVK